MIWIDAPDARRTRRAGEARPTQFARTAQHGDRAQGARRWSHHRLARPHPTACVPLSCERLSIDARGFLHRRGIVHRCPIN